MIKTANITMEFLHEWHFDFEMRSVELLLHAGKPPVTGGFPSQMAKNAVYVFIT